MTAELQSTPAPIRPLPRAATPEPRRWFTPKSIVVYVLLFFGLLAMIGPFLWMLLGSFKEQSEFLRTPPTWLPENPTLENYQRLLGRLDFPRYFLNSILVAGVVTAAPDEASQILCQMPAGLGKKPVFQPYVSLTSPWHHVE